MCSTRLAENTGRKNDAKNRHLHAILTPLHNFTWALAHILVSIIKATSEFGDGDSRHDWLWLASDGGCGRSGHSQHCPQQLAGRADGYQCSRDWGAF